MFIIRNFLIGLFVVFLIVNSAFSGEAEKDTYIIIFQKDAGLIDLPNPENAGKVPVGQPTSGQNKEELVAALGLDGEIIAILEVNNGIIVNMNASEAEKWRSDERVEMIEKSMEGSFLTNAQNGQSDVPLFRNGTLTIPRVDVDEQAGMFQNAILQYDSSINAWRLQDYQVTPVSDIFLVEGDGVELIVKETLPIQMFLKVKGSFSDGCLSLGRINHRLNGNRFEVIISLDSTIPRDGSQACSPVILPFEKIISLPVYGLSSGNYEYIVNGKITGSFELKSDNNL